KTIMHKDDLAALLHNAALASYHEGKDEEALNYFQRALQISPGREESLALLCQLNLRRDGLEQAYLQLKGRVKNIDDLKSPELMKTYAVVMYHMGRTEQAEKLAIKVLRQDPYHKDVLVLMACLSENQDETDRAEWFWRRYLEKQPDSIKARFALIELYAKAGGSRKLREVVEELFCISRDKGVCRFIKEIQERRKDKNLVYQPRVDVIRKASKEALSERALGFMDCGEEEHFLNEK
ncbi:MAG: tetratricopeptide repeat protein, partial [Desulfobacterales bacterium]